MNKPGRVCKCPPDGNGFMMQVKRLARQPQDKRYAILNINKMETSHG